jgi:low temperature requirement protein LtrA
MGTLDFQHNPIILLLAGVGIFTTGTLVRENLVRWGGIFLLIAALTGFLLPVTEQYLVAGIGIVVGYLVPGYHLKKKSLERV